MASKRRTKAKRIFAAAKRGQRASVALPEVLWDRGADGPANRERLRLEPATEIDPETGKETQNPNGLELPLFRGALRVLDSLSVRPEF